MAQKSINRNIKAQMIQEIINRGVKNEIVENILTFAKNEGKNAHFYGDWNVEDVTIAFLWYITVGPTYRKVSYKSKIPKSNLEQHFGTIRRILLRWANTKITGGTAAERLQQAARHISDPLFRDISGYIDCSDFRAVPTEMSKEEKKQLTSWKFKHKTAYKYLFAMTPNEVISFVGPMSGGRRHDVKVLARDALMWRRCQNILSGEKFLADSGFQGSQNYQGLQDVIIFTPYKRTGGQLSAEDQDWNHRLSSLRSKIERSFGFLKNRFRILLRPFYGPPHRHEEILRICVAIYNEDLQIEDRAQNLNVNNLVN